MTSDTCRNGTERCAEALEVLAGDFDMVVNLQGDAPLTPHWFVEDLLTGLQGADWAGMARDQAVIASNATNVAVAQGWRAAAALRWPGAERVP